MHYCPVCLNCALSLASHGVINISINGKQMDTGKFLYNLSKESRETIREGLKVKIEEFFKWYSSFQNIEPIKKVRLYSSDFYCENKCKIPLSKKLSIADVLLSRKELFVILQELGTKYKMTLQLDENL